MKPSLLEEVCQEFVCLVLLESQLRIPLLSLCSLFTFATLNTAVQLFHLVSLLCPSLVLSVLFSSVVQRGTRRVLCFGGVFSISFCA